MIRQRVLRWTVALLAVLTASLLMGANPAHDPTRGHAGAPAATHHGMPLPFTPANDLQFIDGMVPHHQMAVMMADAELKSGQRADVKALAQRIHDDQTHEISQLVALRQSLGGGAQTAMAMYDARMHQAMAAITGPQADDAFLAAMIPHHAEGISMAWRAMPNLKQADLCRMATDIVTNQAREIGQMTAMQQGATP